MSSPIFESSRAALATMFIYGAKTKAKLLAVLLSVFSFQVVAGADAALVIDNTDSVVPIANKIRFYPSGLPQELKSLLEANECSNPQRPGLGSSTATTSELPDFLVTINPATHQLISVESTKSKLQGDEELRWISYRGAGLDIYVIYRETERNTSGEINTSCANAPQITIEETARHTLFRDNVSAIVKLFKPKRYMESTSETGFAVAHRVYFTEKVRAHLKIAVSSVATQNPAANPEPTTITTGPTEHWFISADLPVTKASQLKYDPASRQLVEKDAPDTFYAGFNWMAGDVLKQETRWPDGVTFKFMLKFSRHPLDSFGVGLAYRFGPTKKFGMQMQTLTPFIGHFWTRTDQVTDSGDLASRQRYTGQWRVGISLNLDRAIGWFKSGSEK